MLNSLPHPKPKPTKASRPKKSKSPFCSCKYFSLNRANYKFCAKCHKPLKVKNLRKALERLCDLIVREIVIKRDGFCVCPAPKDGHSGPLQCGHLMTRSKESVKWDLWNCNVQCAACNGRHENFWFYYDNWFKRTFGQEQRDRLGIDAEKSWKLTIEELENLCSELTAIKARQEIDKTFKPRYTQEQILLGVWRKENGKDTMSELSKRIGLGHTGTG
jgi:hypothetical protein